MAGAWYSARAHAADEDVALPRREAVAGVNGHAGHRNLRKPDDERRFHPLAGGVVGDARPWIVAPEAHDRPSVIAARQDDVDFIAAIGPVLVVPQGSRHRMNDQGQRVAVAKGEDFRPVAGAACERVVRRNGTVVAEAEDLATQTRRVLRDLADIAAGRHVDHAVAAEDEAAVQPRVAFVGLRHEEIANVGERAAIEPAPRERRCAFAVLDGLGVGEVDQPVVGETWMERDIHQAAVAVRSHARHAGDRRRVEHAVADQADPAGPFGDQHAPIREEGDTPRVRETPGDDAHADFVLFGRVDHKRPWTQWRHGHADLGLLRAADCDRAQ